MQDFPDSLTSDNGGNAEADTVQTVFAVEGDRYGENTAFIAENRAADARESHSDRIVGCALVVDDMVGGTANLLFDGLPHGFAAIGASAGLFAIRFKAHAGNRRE